MTTCERALKTRAWYCDQFAKELRWAEEERGRLVAMYHEVCWYNFEVHAQEWGYPWPRTNPDSIVEINSARYDRFWNKGREREAGHFKPYCSGPVSKAPYLPAQILLEEVKLATDYVEACRLRLSDPIDYAPGGWAYNHLLESTSVGKNFQ